MAITTVISFPKKIKYHMNGCCQVAYSIGQEQ